MNGQIIILKQIGITNKDKTLMNKAMEIKEFYMAIIIYNKKLLQINIQINMNQSNRKIEKSYNL